MGWYGVVFSLKVLMTFVVFWPNPNFQVDTFVCPAVDTNIAVIIYSYYTEIIPCFLTGITVSRTRQQPSTFPPLEVFRIYRVRTM